MLPRSHNMLKFLYHNASRTSHNTLGPVQLYVVHTGYVKESLGHGIRNGYHTISGDCVITNCSWATFSRCFSSHIHDNTGSCGPTRAHPTIQSDLYQSVGKTRSLSTSSSKETPVETGKEGDSGQPSAVGKTSVGVQPPSKPPVGGRPLDSGKPKVFVDTTHLHLKSLGDKPLDAEIEGAAELEVFRKGSVSSDKLPVGGKSPAKLSVSRKPAVYDDSFSHFEPFDAKPVEEEEEEEEDDEPLPPPKVDPKAKHLGRLAMDHFRTLERNFITPVRAMSDFLLKPTDLEQMRKTKRRSPYENEPPITVYWRKDVEKKAIEVWGSRESLVKEILRRDAERKKQGQDNMFSVKRQLNAYKKAAQQDHKRANRNYVSRESGLFGTSGRVVMTAVVINMSNFAFKLFAWLYTGSHSMFSECVHSLADTINQLILVYGIHKSIQPSDTEHPYGYSNMKYVASLISGVGIFCVGTGLSIYHGVDGLLHPVPLQSFYWAYFILGGSLVSEGATLLVAYNSIRRGAKSMNMTFSEYVLRGQDPSVNVVLMEDFAAVIGVLVAGSCMGLTSYYGSPIPDAVGSLLVGGILGSVASFIIYTNVAALVGRSIQQDRLNRINEELESDIMIRAIHDVKGIDMGNSLVRYKAEVDFDGRELTRSYLEKQDLQTLLQELKAMDRPEQLEIFMLQHGENIVDMMGGEIDRIEMKLRMNHPEIRHCDLEIL